jgi:crotonobetainyl-CoA:carnitine CoA-transferase CaiB-like acyl-CoA transferase
MVTNFMEQDKLSEGPLKGLKIADFTQLAQGPFATQILGDLGADIIKIEPTKGDWLRGLSINDTFLGGVSLSFLSFNRNKRSVLIDLKKEEGVKIVKKIVAGSDVVVENFRPGVMDRLGIGYDVLSQINPRLIYCASCGLGHEGPYVDRPGQDMLVQAMSGIMYLNGLEGQSPYPAPVGMADLSTGLHMVYSILAALYARDRTGEGQRIDLNLWNSMLTMVGQELNSFLNTGSQPKRPQSAIGTPYLGSPYGVYRTLDSYIVLGMGPLNKVARLLEAPGYEHITSSNVMENRDEIHRNLETYFQKKETVEWVKILLAEDIWCGPVYSFKDVEKDPQVAVNGMITEFEHPTAGLFRAVGIPTKFSNTPGMIRRPPPTPGEHTDEILKMFAQCSEEDIQVLRQQGVVK